MATFFLQIGAALLCSLFAFLPWLLSTSAPVLPVLLFRRRRKARVKDANSSKAPVAHSNSLSLWQQKMALMIKACCARQTTGKLPRETQNCWITQGQLKMYRMQYATNQNTVRFQRPLITPGHLPVRQKHWCSLCLSFSFHNSLDVVRIAGEWSRIVLGVFFVLCHPPTCVSKTHLRCLTWACLLCRSMSSRGKDRPMEGIWSGRGTGLISEIVRFDERLSRWVYFDLLPPSLRGATDRLCMLLEYTGHGVPWILLGLIALFAGNDQQQCLAVQLLVGFVIDLAIVGVLKMATCRPRPPYNSTEMLVTVQLDMKFSFPSGHTTRAVFLALFFMDQLRLSLQVALVVWSVCVACSRVLLGRHHVLDVIAAVPVGVTVIALLQCCQGSVVPLLCRTVSNFI